MNNKLLTGLIPVAISLMSLIGHSQEPEYREATRDEKLTAARQLMTKDFNAAFITVDADGQPRARTMEPFPPEADWTIWLATKPITRKVMQIQDNSQVTLYYNDDAAMAYVTIMGTATLHDDSDSKARKKHRLIPVYWPDYPDDYLLISVKPAWLEITTLKIPIDPETWRPQAVRFDE